MRDQSQVEKRIDAELLSVNTNGQHSDFEAVARHYQNATLLAWVLEVNNRPLYLSQRLEDILERQRQVI